MGTIAFDLPEDALVALKLDGVEAGNEIRLAAAVKLYEVGRLPSGAAARLAGIPKVTFLSRLAEFGVATFRQSEQEVAEDLAGD
jgi:predicted HTH domain antitoxin